jgi:hypothetical protein
MEGCYLAVAANAEALHPIFVGVLVHVEQLRPAILQPEVAVEGWEVPFDTGELVELDLAGFGIFPQDFPLLHAGQGLLAGTDGNFGLRQGELLCADGCGTDDVAIVGLRDCIDVSRNTTTVVQDATKEDSTTNTFVIDLGEARYDDRREILVLRIAQHEDGRSVMRCCDASQKLAKRRETFLGVQDVILRSKTK